MHFVDPMTLDLIISQKRTLIIPDIPHYTQKLNVEAADNANQTRKENEP